MATGHFLLGYIHDDWRVGQNLTVNVGLMYQLGARAYDSTDRLGNLWVHRDASGKVVGDLMWATTNPQADPVIPITWHTRPDEWKEPRNFHTPLRTRFAENPPKDA